MTFGELINKIEEVLSEAGVEDARFDSSLIAEEFFPDAKEDSELDANLARQCLLAADTVASGAPVQYVTGKAYFWREKYDVSVGALIPRSDSETVVETALAFCGALDMPQDTYKDIKPVKSDRIEFADVCCGTGCIGISLANELKAHGIDTTVHLGDLSEEALFFANKNSEICKADIDVIKTDITAEDVPWTGLDLITANPPYVTTDEYAELEDKIKLYEPEMALEAGPDGLKFYKPLAEFAKKALKEGGMLIAEHGYRQGDAIRKIFEDCGLKDVNTVKDLSGNDRVTYGRT